MKTPQTAAQILIIEDEKDIRQLISSVLVREGWQALEAGNADEALVHLANAQVSLCLVDWMLPRQSGIELIKRIRANELTRTLPIMMLTARGEDYDKVTGLDAGADDYLVKPFSPRELVSRTRALLRRSQGFEQRPTLKAGDIEIDLSAHQVLIKGQAVHMGQTEYKLLSLFVKHPDRVFSRDQLIDRVWGQSAYIDERTVDVHVLRLRKALRPSESDQHIKTVRGAGYRFASEP